MRYSFFISLLLFTCFFHSCSQPQAGDRATADSLARVQLALQEKASSPSHAQGPKYNFTAPQFILEDHKHKFYAGKITSFDKQFFDQLRLSKGFFDSLYPVLDRESFDVFQNNESVYDRINDDTPYYFSVQDTGAFTGIIIFQMKESWVNEFIYHSYDKSGKLLGSAVLAGRGGDGGYVTEMTGTFINDSVFIKKTIETEHDFEKQVDNVIVNTTDEITIHHNGKITTRTAR